MKWWLLLIAFPLACGAVNLGNLQKPDHEQYFVLEKDYTHVEYRGLVNLRTILGLRAGTYSLVAEDKQGQYFLGPVNCIVMVSKGAAQKYESTGEIPTLEEMNKKMVVPTTGEEGIWLPRDGVKQDPKLFMAIHNRTNGASAGLIGTAIVSWTEGSLIRMPFAGEAQHFAELPRLAGAPPAAAPAAP